MAAGQCQQYCKHENQHLHNEWNRPWRSGPCNQTSRLNDDMKRDKNVSSIVNKKGEDVPIIRNTINKSDRTFDELRL